jgi:hypothetical protein
MRLRTQLTCALDLFRNTPGAFSSGRAAAVPAARTPMMRVAVIEPVAHG